MKVLNVFMKWSHFSKLFYETEKKPPKTMERKKGSEIPRKKRREGRREGEIHVI